MGHEKNIATMEVEYEDTDPIMPNIKSVFPLVKVQNINTKGTI